MCKVQGLLVSTKEKREWRRRSWRSKRRSKRRKINCRGEQEEEEDEQQITAVEGVAIDHEKEE